MGQTTRERRIGVAGLEVAVMCSEAPSAAPLLGDYDRYPGSGAAPDLTIELERIAGFSEGRAPTRTHPSFECGRAGPHTVALSRWDAEGTVELPATPAHPVRARFRVSDNPNAAEAAIRAAFSLAAPRRGALILHASAVADSRAAHVFAGPSGAGKSTIASLLTRAPWRCRLLSDELLVVRRHNDAWYAHATPFAAKTRPEPRSQATLAAIYLLSHAADHARTRLAHGTALPGVMSNVLAHVTESTTASAVLDLTARLTAETPAFTLAFARNADVGKVLDITC